MRQQLRTLCRPLMWLIGLSLMFTECKKSEDTPVTPTPTPQPSSEIKPSVNVGLGAVLLTKEEYEAIPLFPDPLIGGRLAVAGKDPNLPASYDLTPKMPPVGDQGAKGSCTSWAVAYAARSYFNASAKSVNYVGADGKRNDEAVFSPAFINNQLQTQGCGAVNIGKALQLLQDAGVCSWKTMPYSVDNCSQPTPAQRQEAANFKIKKWGRININTNTFKRFLYFDYPIIFGSNLDNNFFALTGKNAAGEYVWQSYDASTTKGGHAMILVGYDDSRKAFKIQNSWTDRWANKGYLWLSYDIVQTAVREAYVMVPGEISPDFRQPTVKTEAAGPVTNGQIELKGSVTSLGDLPFLRYGICVSATQPLPTEQVEVKGVPITVVPQAFSVKVSATGSKLYYRAFAETTGGIVYGDTISVSTKAIVTEANRQLGTLLVHTPQRIYALNTATGTVKWEFKETSNVGEGGASANGVYYVATNAGLYGVNVSDGTIKWRSDAKTNGATMPIVSNGLVYSTDGNTVYALDAGNGTKKWEYAVASGSSANMTVANSLLFVTVEAKDKTYALDASTGQLKREFDGSSRSGNPVVAEGVLYLITPSKVSAYDVANGTVKWESAGSFGNTQSATVYSNTVFLTTGSGTTTPQLLALDGSTGRSKWVYNLYDANTVRTGYIQVLNDPDVTNGVVIINGSDNFYTNVYAVDAASGQLKWEADADRAVAPVSSGTNVFLLSARADGTRPNLVNCYDPQTGKPIWGTYLSNFGFSGTLCFVTTSGQAYHITKSGMKQ